MIFNHRFRKRGNTSGFLFLALLIIIFAGLISCTTRVDVFEIITASPEIKVSTYGHELQNKTGSYSFDHIQVQESIEETFTITNAGSLPLTIKGISFSDDYEQFYIDDSFIDTYLEPDESTLLVVTFIPTRAGTFTMYLTLESDDPDDELFTFTITGEALQPESQVPEPDIEVYVNGVMSENSRQIDLGKTYVGTSKPAEIKIKNTGEADLYVSDLNYNGNLAYFSRYEPEIPVFLKPGDFITFQVIFTPSNSSKYEIEVIIISNDPDEDDFAVTITGEGTEIPVPDIKVSAGGIEIPSGTGTYDFGIVQVSGSTGPVTFRIENTGTKALIVKNIKISGSEQSEFLLGTPQLPLTILSGGSSDFTIAFSPNSEGIKNATVQIDNNDPDTSESPFIFDITGTATTSDTSDIRVKIDSLTIANRSIGYDFGIVTIGDTTPSQTFIINNVGTDDLEVSEIKITRKNADQFSIETSSTFNLGPLGEAYLTIKYNPTKKGSHTANINITSNDPDTPTFTFTVKGEATTKDTPNMQIYVDGQPYYDGSSYYFGEYPKGESSEEVTFTIKNEGTTALNIKTFKKRGGEIKDFDVSFSKTPFTIHPGEENYFTVIFTPSETGSRSTRLEIKNNIGKYNLLLEGSGL